jgi:hypothetical protein
VISWRGTVSSCLPCPRRMAPGSYPHTDPLPPQRPFRMATSADGKSIALGYVAVDPTRLDRKNARLLNVSSAVLALRHPSKAEVTWGARPVWDASHAICPNRQGNSLIKCRFQATVEALLSLDPGDWSLWQECLHHPKWGHPCEVVRQLQPTLHMWLMAANANACLDPRRQAFPEDC